MPTYVLYVHSNTVKNHTLQCSKHVYLYVQLVSPDKSALSKRVIAYPKDIFCLYWRDAANKGY
jgi:hypothetical protein